MIIQTGKMAWNAVCANKLRTFLTMLGIIIGVAALIILVSIADGAGNSVSSQISQMGSNYLSVQISDNKENPLKLSEFSEIMNADEFLDSAPMGRNSVTGKSGYTSGSVNLYGTSGGYFSIMNMELYTGRLLKQTDLENHSHVIVLSYDTAVEFFGRADADGESLSLDGQTFQVVGVLSQDSVSPSSAMMVRNSDDSSEIVTLEGYIPYSTLSRISDYVLEITQFYVSSVNQESMDQAERKLEERMMARFDHDEEAFTIQNQSEVMEAMEEVDHTMSLMLGGIAVISLLVGGIGIMNIMLVSVTERTREIGIRKAIGAGQGSIMLQFLLEALMVSMAGCMVGIGISFAVLKVIGQVMGSAMEVSMDGNVTLLSVAFSGVIGIVFGLYPAQKAARKKPIDALRYSG
ncbi:MAG: FtsX-like permease family protein [Lachnospiraceae bacterium]|nr:FtsX-like permease family protein [Lachnospiraceae bacterium]